MRSRTAVLAAMLAMAPLGTRAADLVVWWEEPWYPEEERAIAEMIAAFEHQAGTKVELVQIPSGAGEEVQAALEAGQPPDFLWGLGGTTTTADQWAYEDRLVDLAETLDPSRSCSTPTCWNAPRSSTGMAESPASTRCRWGA
jgi:ABC-type glycerol-3-phosphate transport system substrate-binding protein